MGIEKKVLSIRMDQELIDELKILAKNDNRPLSNLVETVLKQYIAKNKKSHKNKTTE